MIKTRSGIEDYYKNEFFPLRFFINNGGDGVDDNATAKKRRALFGSGVGSGSGFKAVARSVIPAKHAAKVVHSNCLFVNVDRDVASFDEWLM